MRSYKELHRELRRFQPRLRRAIIKAMRNIRERLSITELAAIISSKDRKLADKYLRREIVDDALIPSSAIVKDAFIKGGKVGAELLNKVHE